MTRRIAIIALAAAGLTSCATVPKSLQGEFSPTTPREAVVAASGQHVRWGGEIIKVEPRDGSTCFEVLSRELDSSARPREKDTSAGRFIACQPGFQDPELFKRGREITVTGRVTGTEQGRIGDFDYTYPVVQADTVHLWKRRPLYVNTPYYDPWMGFGPWGYGPYWGPYRGGGPIIIHERGTGTKEAAPVRPPMSPQPPQSRSRD